MKRFCGLVALGALCVWNVAAQLSVELTFDQEHYLAGERMMAVVRIVNYTGRTLRLGQDPGWLEFSVETSDGRIVEQLGEPAVVEPFDLPSASRGTRRVDLTPYYNMAGTGRYLVRATVRIPELSQELTSKVAGINVVSGARIWAQDFGVPGPVDRPPEVRKYALVTATIHKRPTLYARVADLTETRIFRVATLGPVLAFTYPEPQVDRSGQLHVLFQTGAQQFTYVVLNPDGEIVLRQRHQYGDGRPRLRVNDEGRIGVAGGFRARSADDLPVEESPKEEEPKTTPDAAKPTEPGTPPAEPSPAVPSAPPSTPSQP